MNDKEKFKELIKIFRKQDEFKLLKLFLIFKAFTKLFSKFFKLSRPSFKASNLERFSVTSFNVFLPQQSDSNRNHAHYIEAIIIN